MSNPPLKLFTLKHYAPTTASAYYPNVSTGACNGPNVGAAGVRFAEANRPTNDYGDPKHRGCGPLRVSALPTIACSPKRVKELLLHGVGGTVSGRLSTTGTARASARIFSKSKPAGSVLRPGGNATSP